MPDIESKKLAARVVSHCGKKGIVLSVAESCTGGMIATAITSVSGSSKVFDRGFVVYSDISKTDMLGVSPDTLKSQGSVSEQAVLEMAQGAIKFSRAQLALAVSGIAGPSGGTDDKPVGMVYIGWASREGKNKVRKFQFKGSRDEIRQSTTIAALSMILIETNGLG
ncbi:MAG: CinA family protein [Bacteroidia bacterium]|nr:CinA family protein [Bacteroidia bacterium]